MGPALPGSQAAPLPSNLPFRIISKNIGTGAYAFIRKATPLHASHPVIAIKFINKAHAFTHGRLTPVQLEREITLHKHLGRHPNIILCFAAGSDAAWTWLALELADGGDLFDKIEPDVGVGEDIAHFYFWQLINAVGFMHSKGIAHRDIKPENVLLSGEGNLKVADFGLATLFEKDGQKRLCHSVCGSPPYIAPEVVKGRRSKRPDLLDPGEGYAANICDIWSCGVVLFVLLVGNTPWDEPTMRSEEFKEFVEKGKDTTDELWKQIPDGAMDLLLGMLTLEPAQRYTIDRINAHPWFNRKNRYLSPSGRSTNPIGLAAEMLSQLRIDFSKVPTASQRQSQPSQLQEADAMELDSSSSPRRSMASPPMPPLVTANQPITPFEPPTGNAPVFDWPAPSQQRTYQTFSTLPASTQEALSQDPSLSQFSQQKPSIEEYMTLTQAARQFRDVLPASSFARFLSPLEVAELVRGFARALSALGVAWEVKGSKAGLQEGGEEVGEGMDLDMDMDMGMDADDANAAAAVPELTHSSSTVPTSSSSSPSEPLSQLAQLNPDMSAATLRIRLHDSRRQALSGHVVVERVCVGADVWSSEVRFVKGVGDPLEWRRFFRNVVVWLGERVVLRPGR
ncbi:Pkinase-domain-containing protein [Westerdykella ornata]|uniref:non-specific serine/threonine protein kinase n=1 Tax=Westerdykella ornata TaxID=318751 RepID=A0A6A6JJT8_WESOR|nr:Pkinase-domain-containing protein [Westerdykella ornata]KAF2275129.1 Pkinase-domain-containing protein [Westerdykella ornata]